MPDEVELVGDWDCAAPGTRLWDLAYAIHGFIPLSANPAHQRPDTDHRLRVFVNAYGLDEQQRRELIPLLSRRCRAMYDFREPDRLEESSRGAVFGEKDMALPGLRTPTGSANAKSAGIESSAVDRLSSAYLLSGDQ